MESHILQGSAVIWYNSPEDDMVSMRLASSKEAVKLSDSKGLSNVWPLACRLICKTNTKRPSIEVLAAKPQFVSANPVKHLLPLVHEVPVSFYPRLSIDET